jgi:hypothetical protein
LFAQVAIELHFVSEEIAPGPFLSVWFQEHPEEAEAIVSPILSALFERDNLTK